jgi:hypothetical protein
MSGNEKRLVVGDRVAVFDTGDGTRGYATITHVDTEPGADRLDDFAVQIRFDGETDERFVSKFNRDALCVLAPQAPAEREQERKLEKSEHQARKDRPLFRGCLDYFPDALMGVAEISRIGNEQHHPGAPLHWEKDKSSDHADCCARHLTDRGTKDSDGADHSGKAAWRALALYQTELEAANPELAKLRQAQRDAAAKGLR